MSIIDPLPGEPVGEDAEITLAALTAQVVALSAQTSTLAIALALKADIDNPTFTPSDPSDPAIDVDGHLVATGPTPPSVTPGVGAGSGAGASVISGTDMAGIVQLVAGTGTSGGVLFTVNFADAYGSTPKAVLLIPASPGAVTARCYVAVDAMTFQVVAMDACGDLTYHFWYYMVIG